MALAGAWPSQWRQRWREGAWGPRECGSDPGPERDPPGTPCRVGQGEAAGEQGHRPRAPHGQGGQGLREEGSTRKAPRT